jgi:c-di-GMP-binding flagellar brake protein YcgR
VTNKRQHERLEIAVRVTLSYQGRQITTQTKNVSAGGMLIEGGIEFPYGTVIRVKGLLPVPPSGQEIDADATVRWVRDGAIGVQFVSLRAKETWAIHQLLKALESKPA